MKRIVNLIEALYRGKQLADVETWKVGGTALAAVHARDGLIMAKVL
jgi:hypothetical protein